HLFQPLLYQVATGSLSPGEIAAPLRSVLRKQKNTEVLLGEAADIDPQNNRLTLRDGAQFEYDSLIVATGSQTSYYGNDSWREVGPRVRTAFPEDLSKRAEQLVSTLGVKVLKGVKVTNVDADGVTFERGSATEKLRAKTVLWTGGVTANEFGRILATRTQGQTDRSSGIQLTPRRTIPSLPT